MKVIIQKAGGWLVVPLLMMLSGCRNRSEAALADRFEEQSGDLEGVRKSIERTKVKLTEIERLREDLNEIQTLKETRELGASAMTVMESELAELQGELVVSGREFELLRKKARARIRKAWVGQRIDLSKTKGENYEDARVYAVLPTGIKVLLATGVETVALADLPETIRELFLMSEGEAAEHRDRLGNTAKARAEGYRKWKQKQEEEPTEAEGKAQQRMAEVRKRMLRIEKEILRRMDVISALKSKASAWELKSAKSIGTKKRSRAMRYALAYREEAQEIADGNGRAREVVAVLRAELRDLQESFANKTGAGSGR